MCHANKLALFILDVCPFTDLCFVEDVRVRKSFMEKLVSAHCILEELMVHPQLWEKGMFYCWGRDKKCLQLDSVCLQSRAGGYVDLFSLLLLSCSYLIKSWSSVYQNMLYFSQYSNRKCKTMHKFLFTHLALQQVSLSN